MPKNIAQWTGFAVTVIIVLGRDADVLTAVPFGIAAGMLATLFQQAMRLQLRPVRLSSLPLIRLPRLYSRGRHLLPQGEKERIAERCTIAAENSPLPLPAFARASAGKLHTLVRRSLGAGGWERVRRADPGAGEGFRPKPQRPLPGDKSFPRL